MFRMTFNGTIVGQGPQIETTVNGNKVCSMVVVVRGADCYNSLVPGGAVKDPIFVRVSAFGRLGEQCAKHLGPKRSVTVVGRATVSLYRSKNDGIPKVGFNVEADEVEFGNKGESDQTGNEAPANAPKEEPKQGNGYVPDGFVAVSEDELPF